MLTNKKQSSNFLKLLLTVVFIFSLTACEPSLEKIYTSSKLELRQLVKETETIKQASGYYFMISGAYGSTERNHTSIKVFAKVNGMYRLIEIPIEDIRINIDNTLNKPNIEIQYESYDKYEIDEELLNQSWKSKRYIINCPEVYLPERLLPINM